ncbi:hypothetical protein BCR36DRAFT_359939 [Piromyces finnis]|uniref:Uncharacterized protein n=1 Tax=Piromyces finnis TaxID=1754191 RepID=A0A1Y1V049_9FUNG|nr:hypothetical protein BCR36DRAFT_359939 [Piromyces finnis]|eukprot:ORX44383.1 hypothetical protein BCR36DRAFT_359939 [Piromyces finnis]
MKSSDKPKSNSINSKKGNDNATTKPSKSPITIPIKYSNKMFSKNEKGKNNKHISVSIFNFKNHKRSSSVTLPFSKMSFSKLTAQLKQSHRQSNSGNYLSFKPNINSNTETSSINSEKKSRISTSLSFPPIFKNNSTKDEGNSITASKSKTNGIDSIYNKSCGRYASSTPILNYQNPTSITPKSTKNKLKYIPRTRRKSSLSSLSKTSISKSPSSPLTISETENEKESINKKVRSINHPKINTLKNKTDTLQETSVEISNGSSSNQSAINNINEQLVCNDTNIQNNENILVILDGKKNIQKHNNDISNKVFSNDTVKSCNSNCTTFCTNTSCDNLCDSKELASSQIENNSSETINKESTLSMFMPKAVLGKNSLQHSMQREINGIIERFDQTSLNDISGLDQESTRMNTNNLLLTALNNDIVRSKNKSVPKSGISTNITNENITKNITTYQNELKYSDSRIYLSDIDIACLDINKINSDLSESIPEPLNIVYNDTITVAPVTITEFNDIPNATNNPISSYESGLNLINRNLSDKELSQSSEQIFAKNSKISDGIKNDANINKNIKINKINNQSNDYYLNEKINHVSLNKILHGDVHTSVLENASKGKQIKNMLQDNVNKIDNEEQKPKIKARVSSLRQTKNQNTDIIIKEDENLNQQILEKKQNNTNDGVLSIKEPVFNNMKHHPQLLQVTPSYLTNYHHDLETLHFSKNKELYLHSQNSELINNKSNIESLNALKTALLFLSKNESNSINNDDYEKNNSLLNRKSDPSISIFTKRKSANTISAVNNKVINNKKYLSLPSLLSSNTLMPLTDGDDGMLDNCKVMYSVRSIDSGRKLRAYYGIDCPIFLGDGSKLKMSNYYGANLYDEVEDKNKENKRKNQKFGIKRLTSFLHLSSNELSEQEYPKDKLKNDKEDSKKEDCPVEYIPVSMETKEEKEDPLNLYNKNGEIIQNNDIDSNPINKEKIIIPVKSVVTPNYYNGGELKNVGDLIKKYDKDSEIYSSKEFSFKDSFSYTLPCTNASLKKSLSLVNGRDETKTTFNMIPSHLRNVITTPTYQGSFCDTEPYLSSFSFEHSISEYSSSDNSFASVNVKKITSTTTTTMKHQVNSSVLKNEINPLELDNSYVIKKAQDEEEEIEEDNISFSIDEGNNIDSSFNDICRHSTSKIKDEEVDSLFLHTSNMYELPEVDIPKQDIRNKQDNKLNNSKLNISSTSFTQEEINSSLFKELYNKSFIKETQNTMSYSTTSYSYDSFSENPINNNYSFLLDEIYNNGKNTNKKLNNNSDSDDDYNFYDPPEDLNYCDNYFVNRKKKYRLKKPTKTKNNKEEISLKKTNNTSKLINIDSLNSKISSLNNIYDDNSKSLNIIPDIKNSSSLTATTTTKSTVIKNMNNTQNATKNQSLTKSEYSIKNTETKTTIIEDDKDDGYSSSISVTSFNTKLKIFITNQTQPDSNIIKKPQLSERKSSLSFSENQIGFLSKINNENILLSDEKTKKIIQTNIELKNQNSVSDNKINNDTSMEIESNINVVMKGEQSDYELNLEGDDNEDNQSISFIRKNTNTIKQNLIMERKCKRTKRNESKDAIKRFPNSKNDGSIFQKMNINQKKSKKSLLTTSLHSHHSTDLEKDDQKENKTNQKGTMNMSIDGNVFSKYDTYSTSLQEFPDLYPQSISSSLSSISISDKYSKMETQDRYDLSMSSFSQSDFYEETDTEYSFISNNIKLYHRQKAKHYAKNREGVTYQCGDSMNFFNDEEYSATEILKYADVSNEQQYNGETFNADQIENVDHYHSLLSQFLLELLKNECSEYFFIFHDMIQFQYKVFQNCEQFTREGQEIFNTYLTNSSALKITIDTKLVHKIAYGIKYYDRCCFIPLINLILKVLENKYLKYKLHQQPIVETEDPNHKKIIMEEYCDVLDKQYSTNINSLKILNGQESPNQIYKNMLIRKKVLDFYVLMFGKDYLFNKKNEGYYYKSKIINFSEKLINPTIKIK